MFETEVFLRSLQSQRTLVKKLHVLLKTVSFQEVEEVNKELKIGDFKKNSLTTALNRFPESAPNTSRQ